MNYWKCTKHHPETTSCGRLFSELYESCVQEHERSKKEFNDSVFEDMVNLDNDGGYYFQTIDEQNGIGFKRPYSDCITNVIKNMQHRNNNTIYFSPNEKNIMNKKPVRFCGIYAFEDDDYEFHYKKKYGINLNDNIFRLIVDFIDDSDTHVCMVNQSKSNFKQRWNDFRGHYLGGKYVDWL